MQRADPHPITVYSGLPKGAHISPVGTGQGQWTGTGGDNRPAERILSNQPSQSMQNIQSTQSMHLPSMNTVKFDDECLARIANIILHEYDKDRSNYIDQAEISPLMMAAYDPQKPVPSPSQIDVQSYLSTHDSDGDGRLSQSDIFHSLKRTLGDPTGINIYRSHTHKAIYSLVEQSLGRSRVEGELSRARSLFRKYDRNNSGYLERDEIRQMMIDSYRILRKTFNPTDNDIDQFTRLMDSSGDSLVSLDEYEVYVLRSLQRRQLHL
jgi:Ca2+-binding EF-hand superfamily protein